jgi:hypothetical protein
LRGGVPFGAPLFVTLFVSPGSKRVYIATTTTGDRTTGSEVRWDAGRDAEPGDHRTGDSFAGGVDLAVAHLNRHRKVACKRREERAYMSLNTVIYVLLIILVIVVILYLLGVV